MKTIGVLVCNRNYNDFLPGLFETLASQTLKDFKVFLCDYGSDISPEKILKEFPFQSSFLSMSEGNLQQARNFVAQNSQSKFICYPDADSLLEPNFLEELYWTHNGTVAFTYCDFWYMRSNTRHLCQVPDFDENNIKGWQMSILLRREYFPGLDVSFEKLQDWELWLSIYHNFKGTGKRVPLPLFTHLQPIGKTISWRLMGEHKYWKNCLKEKYPDLTKNW